MLLGIIPGSEIIVSVEGIDEYEAIQFIKEQLANYYLLRG
jgi:phosphotransferase system HPr-like phosphotransfer protein